VIREYSAQLERDKVIIDDYLRTQNITFLSDQEGVRYVITTPGPTSGLTPLSADSVVVNYTAKFLSDQKVFDKTLEPTGFRLNKITTLRAWKSVFLLFKEGTKATLYVPSGLGYGAYGTTIGTTVVPPYSNLMYDIELVKVIRK
jgi:FKBP-type peptidyl-prolyl cis-trans isomerase FkpA